MKTLKNKYDNQKNQNRRLPVKTQDSMRPLTLSELAKIGGGDRPRGGNY